MKKKILFLSLIISVNLFSQKEANFWYFGNNAGLDFNLGTPTTLEFASNLNTIEGCSSFSDADGKLLFYVGAPSPSGKNLTVWNKNNDPMPNGVNLNGDSSSSQSALTVPAPGKPNIYYLFTVGAQSSNNAGFWYYTIDMSKENGLGDVSGGAVKLGDPSEYKNWSEKVTAVKANECDAFWVISNYSNIFYAYKVNSSGVASKPKISKIDNYYVSDARGYLKVSPDGKTLVAANMQDGAYIFNFNDVTGEITNLNNSTSPTRLSMNGNSYGVEFSASSRRVYISTGEFRDATEYLYQFDLTQNTINSINASRYLVHYYSNSRGALQLGPDGKIYWTSDGSRYISVINNPDGLKQKSNYSHQSVFVGEKATQGLPPFISSLLLPVIIKDDNNAIINNESLKFCIGNSVTITPEEVETNSPPIYEWTYDDGFIRTKIANTKSITLNDLKVNDSGTYRLAIKLKDKCNNNSEYKANFDLIIGAKPIVKNIDNYIECDFDTNTLDGITTFNLQSKEASIIEAGKDVTINFYEPTDISFNNPITNTTEYRNTTSPYNHKLIVRVTNNEFDCDELGELNLQVNSTSLNNYDNIYKSENEINEPNAVNSNGSGDTTFNFEDKIDAIIAKSSGAFNRTDYQFSFYRNINDADNEINSITPPYNTYLYKNNTDIFVRISRGNTCAGVGRFKLFVNVKPKPKGDIDGEFICVSNPRDNPQLETVDLNANTGNSTDTYKWYVNNKEIIGETDAILKANQEGTYRVEAYRFYENNPSITTDNVISVGFNTFTIKESNVALVASIEFLDDQDLPSENTLTIQVTGKGIYQYAINDDKSNFKTGTENLTYTFTNVKPGLNKVYIKDSNGCGITATKEVSFIYIQRHFSPNNDGKFDTWKVQGLENTFYNTVNLQVFDRFGKLLKVIDQKNENGWDGRLNGNLLPPNDYWYNAVLIDINGNIRKKTGHFSLVSD